MLKIGPQGLKTTTSPPELVETVLFALGFARWDCKYTECVDRRMSLGRKLDDYEVVWGATYWRASDLTPEFKAQFRDGQQSKWHVLPTWQSIWYVEDADNRGYLLPWTIPLPLTSDGATLIWKRRWLPYLGKMEVGELPIVIRS